MEPFASGVYVNVLRTSDSTFRLVQGERANELHLKRNLGLLLARLPELYGRSVTTASRSSSTMASALASLRRSRPGSPWIPTPTSISSPPSSKSGDPLAGGVQAVSVRRSVSCTSCIAVAHRQLADRGITVGRSYVNEYCTSLDMAGASLTLVRLDEEIERLLRAPAEVPIRVF
jgi:hypothetical protein